MENGFYVLPPPKSISLSKSPRNSQNFPQPTSSEMAFGGSRKAVSDGPSSRGFAFGTFCPPHFSSSQEIPSDTKLLLTKNYFEIIIFEKLRMSYVIP